MQVEYLIEDLIVDLFFEHYFLGIVVRLCQIEVIGVEAVFCCSRWCCCLRS